MVTCSPFHVGMTFWETLVQNWPLAFVSRLCHSLPRGDDGQNIRRGCCHVCVSLCLMLSLPSISLLHWQHACRVTFFFSLKDEGKESESNSSSRSQCSISFAIEQLSDHFKWWWTDYNNLLYSVTQAMHGAVSISLASVLHIKLKYLNLFHVCAHSVKRCRQLL